MGLWWVLTIVAGWISIALLAGVFVGRALGMCEQACQESPGSVTSHHEAA